MVGRVPPSLGRSHSPFQAWTSDPQMLHTVTRTSTAPGSGAGTVVPQLEAGTGTGEHHGLTLHRPAPYREARRISIDVARHILRFVAVFGRVPGSRPR